MIKVILFDADGVLINGEKFSVNLEREYGISKEKTLPFFTGIFKECIIGNADLKEVIKPYLKDWGWEKSVEELLDFWFKSEHKIDEELVKYIQQLRQKGIQCYLATNQEKYRATYMLDKMGFKDCFDQVFASAHLGHKKPDLEFFSKVMEKLSEIKKDEVLFWDDTLENIEAAIQFGIKAEFYTNFQDFKEKMQNYL